MFAKPDDFSLVHHDDLIRFHYRADPLCDDQLCCLFQRRGKKLPRIFASVAVSTALVESSRINIFGRFKRARGNAQSLLLTAGNVYAALTKLRIVSICQF